MAAKFTTRILKVLIGWLRHTLIIPFVYQFANKVVTVSKAIRSGTDSTLQRSLEQN